MTPRLVIAALVANLATMALPMRAAAQDVPVVFVHGIFSHSSTWSATSQRLASVLRITPYLVDMPSTAVIETQASVLDRTMGGLPSNTIAVGHSQGGLISRHWSRSRPLGGILTLGTPHGGSQLSARALDLINFNYLVYSVAGLAGAYGAGTEFAAITAAIASSLAHTQLLSWSVASAITSSVAVASFAPVAPQLAPGSPFLLGLNSAPNLVRESQAVMRRVGLVYSANEYWRGGAAVGLSPANREWAYWVIQVMPPVFEYVAAYIDANYPPLNLGARAFASRLRNLAGLTRELDPMWCWAVTGDRLCRIPHDGIVSVVDQYYPGGLNFGVSGPAHTEESGSSDAAIRSVLTGVMNVTARGAAPPPPPIGGPGPGSVTGGQRLYADQEWRSANGAVTLRYQSDGNLVLSDLGGTPLWASDTVGSSTGYTELQTDGNFVIYDASGSPIWATATNAPGGYLTVHAEGYLMLYNSSNVGLWWTGCGSP